MKSLFSWITILTVLGAETSYLLFPSKEDLAFHALKSGKSAVAEKYYLQEYNRGNRSSEVMVSLSTLYERQGNVEDAIAVMEEYSAAHPDDIFALRRLGDLYRVNQDYNAYFQTLLEFQKRSPKGDKLLHQELAGWYQNADDQERSFQILQTLVASGEAGESDYLTLAFLYAAKKENAKALSLLKVRREFFPDKVILDDILFEVWLDVALSKENKGDVALQEEALQLWAHFLIEKKNPKLIFYSLGVVQNRYPDLAPQLIDKLDAEIAKDPRLEVASLQVLWDHPQERQQVFDRLLVLTKKKPSDPVVQNLAFMVYLDRDDDVLLQELIGNIQAGKIEERSIINFAIFCLARDRPDLSLAMEKALGSEYLKKNPVVAISLDLAAKREGSQEALDQLMASSHLTQTDRYFLLRVAAAADLRPEVLELGSQLFPYRGMEDYELLDIAQAYIQVKKTDVLYPLIEEASFEIGEQNTGMMQALLDLSSGDSKKVARWLQAQSHLKDYVFSAFYVVAEEKKEYPLALYIAKRRFSAYPSSLSEADYALALVQVGKIDSGLAILQRLYLSHPQNASLERVYFAALVAAAKRAPDYLPPLREFIATKEARGGLSRQMQRDFGYAYLDVLHDSARAEVIFLGLSEHATGRSTDLQNLIYLWGPQRTEAHVQWIEKRAESASREDLGEWLEDLNFVGAYTTTVALFQKREGEGLAPNAYFAYLDALDYLDDKKDLKETVQKSVLRVHSIKERTRLANYAENVEMRKEIWRAAVSQHPGDATAWQNLARADFDAHDYNGSYKAYRKFFDLLCPSYQAFEESGFCQGACALEQCLKSEKQKLPEKFYESCYQFGQVLKKRMRNREAKTYFSLGLRQLEGMRDKNFFQMEYEALLLYQLDRVSQAEKLFHHLFELSGRDPNIAADYANFMIDEGYLRGARAFLYHLVGKKKCRVPRTTGKRDGE